MFQFFNRYHSHRKISNHQAQPSYDTHDPHANMHQTTIKNRQSCQIKQNNKQAQSNEYIDSINYTKNKLKDIQKRQFFTKTSSIYLNDQIYKFVRICTDGQYMVNSNNQIDQFIKKQIHFAICEKVHEGQIYQQQIENGNIGNFLSNTHIKVPITSTNKIFNIQEYELMVFQLDFKNKEYKINIVHKESLMELYEFEKLKNMQIKQTPELMKGIIEELQKWFKYDENTLTLSKNQLSEKNNKFQQIDGKTNQQKEVQNSQTIQHKNLVNMIDWNGKIEQDGRSFKYKFKSKQDFMTIREFFLQIMKKQINKNILINQKSSFYKMDKQNNKSQQKININEKQLEFIEALSNSENVKEQQNSKNLFEQNEYESFTKSINNNEQIDQQINNQKVEINRNRNESIIKQINDMIQMRQRQNQENRIYGKQWVKQNIQTYENIPQQYKIKNQMFHINENQTNTNKNEKQYEEMVQQNNLQMEQNNRMIEESIENKDYNQEQQSFQQIVRQNQYKYQSQYKQIKDRQFQLTTINQYSIHKQNFYQNNKQRIYSVDNHFNASQQNYKISSQQVNSNLKFIHEQNKQIYLKQIQNKNIQQITPKKLIFSLFDHIHEEKVFNGQQKQKESDDIKYNSQWNNIGDLIMDKKIDNLRRDENNKIDYNNNLVDGINNEMNKDDINMVNQEQQIQKQLQRYKIQQQNNQLQNHNIIFNTQSDINPKINQLQAIEDKQQQQKENNQQIDNELNDQQILNSKPIQSKQTQNYQINSNLLSNPIHNHQLSIQKSSFINKLNQQPSIINKKQIQINCQNQQLQRQKDNFNIQISNNIVTQYYMFNKQSFTKFKQDSQFIHTLYQVNSYSLSKDKSKILFYQKNNKTLTINSHNNQTIQIHKQLTNNIVLQYNLKTEQFIEKYQIPSISHKIPNLENKPFPILQVQYLNQSNDKICVLTQRQICIFSINQNITNQSFIQKDLHQIYVYKNIFARKRLYDHVFDCFNIYDNGRFLIVGSNGSFIKIFDMENQQQANQQIIDYRITKQNNKLNKTHKLRKLKEEGNNLQSNLILKLNMNQINKQGNMNENNMQQKDIQSIRNRRNEQKIRYKNQRKYNKLNNQQVDKNRKTKKIKKQKAIMNNQTNGKMISDKVANNKEYKLYYLKALNSFDLSDQNLLRSNNIEYLDIIKQRDIEQKEKIEQQIKILKQHKFIKQQSLEMQKYKRDQLRIKLIRLIQEEQIQNGQNGMNQDRDNRKVRGIYCQRSDNMRYYIKCVQYNQHGQINCFQNKLRLNNRSFIRNIYQRKVNKFNH